MPSFEQLSSAQKARAALLRDVQAISKETCHLLGLEISKPAIEIVTELVYKKLSVYGTDLEAFAKHAKRATINTDDVKLLARRCPSLKLHLEAIAPSAPSTRAQTSTSKEKKRKTIAVAGQSATPSSTSKESELTSKQKKPESTSRKPETPTPIANDEAELDSMVADELIDLTFD